MPDAPAVAPPATEPPVTPTRPPGPTGLYHVTAIVATVGVAVALVGLLLLFRPVETPVQDCGTAIGFILDGRTNVFVDIENPPEGITTAEATANNDRPCRSRVADAAKPGAVLLLAGMVAALGAAMTEGIGRFAGWIRWTRAANRAAAD